MHCKVFSSVLGLYQLDASGRSPPPSSCDDQKYLQISSNIPWGQDHTQLRTTALVCEFLSFSCLCLILGHVKSVLDALHT